MNVGEMGILLYQWNCKTGREFCNTLQKQMRAQECYGLTNINIMHRSVRKEIFEGCSNTKYN